MTHHLLTQYAVRDAHGRFTGRYRFRLFPTLRRTPSTRPVPDRVPVIAGCVVFQILLVLFAAYMASAS